MKDIISPIPTDAVALSAHTTLRWVSKIHNIEYFIYNNIYKKIFIIKSNFYCTFFLFFLLIIYFNLSIYMRSIIFNLIQTHFRPSTFIFSRYYQDINFSNDFLIQMVWATSNKIGCAIRRCSNMYVFGSMWKQATFLVCNYSIK